MASRKSEGSSESAMKKCEQMMASALAEKVKRPIAKGETVELSDEG